MFHCRTSALLCGFSLTLAACDTGPVNPTEQGAAPLETAANPTVSSVVTGTWRTMPALVPARASMAAGVLDKSIVVVGGLTGSNAHAMWRVDAYNIETKTWTQLRSLPESRFGVYGVTPIHGKLYVAGGSTTSPDGIEQRPVKTLFVYDPATNSWSRKADVPALSGCGAYQANLLGRLYVYQPCNIGPGNQALWAYSPTKNAWTTLRTPPSHHLSGVAGVIDDKLYVTGGSYFNGTDYVMNTELDVYDPSTNSWTIKKPMPSGRAQSPFATTGRGKLFVAGGMTEPFGGPTSDLQVYDASTDTWTTGPSMASPRWGGASAYAGGKFFTIGGSDLNDAFTSKVEAFIASIDP
jgi:N-acetylneuraminic acid mutarotase